MADVEIGKPWKTCPACKSEEKIFDRSGRAVACGACGLSTFWALKTGYAARSNALDSYKPRYDDAEEG